MPQFDSSPHASSDCPSPKRLCNWLDGRQDLEEREIEHVTNCDACANWIEQHTAAPEFLGRIPEDADEQTTIYDQEPEFKDLQRRLADPSNVPTPRRSKPASVHLKMDHLQLGLPPRYVVRRPIASGGIAAVFLAFDQALSQDVAIKVLKRESENERKRFLREARILADLEHPNVVRVFDVGELNSTNTDVADIAQSILGLPYIVMEFVDGGTMAQLACGSETDYSLVAQRLVDAANGLVVAHKHGLIHRDVKPTNLLIDKAQSVCKVADFGLARFSNADATQITRVDELVGTPAYMSPEQVAGTESNEQLTHRTDIYSLGATMYFLLTGHAPLQGTTVGILRQIPEIDPVAPRILYPDLPRDLESICARAMEKDPAARYQTMDEFSSDLQRFLNGQPTVARPLSSSRQLLRWSRRNRALAIALATVCALLLVLGIGAAVAAGVLWNQKQALVAQQQRTLNELSNRIAIAEPEFLPVAFSDLHEYRSEVVVHLEQLWDQRNDSRSRLNIACALNTLGVDRSAFLVDELGQSLTRPGQCLALCIALSTDSTKSLRLIEQKWEEETDLARRVKLAIVALHLGDDRFVQQLAESSPEQRTELIHTIPKWHADLSQLIKYCGSSSNSRLLMAMLLGLALVDRQEFSDEDIENLAGTVGSLRASSSDSGVQSSLRWMQRRFSLNTFVDSRASARPQGLLDVSSPESLALHPTQGFRMLHVKAGSFEMGSNDARVNFDDRAAHTVTLTRDFMLADQEVSLGLFRVFLAARSSVEKDVPWQCDRVISPSDDHPVQQVTWFEAAEFCNWLSKLHGLTPCYVNDGFTTVTDAEGQNIEFANWTLRPLATGYRLPTEAEFEYVCRAGTDTLYSFGDEMQYFDHYVAWSNNTRIATAACGSLMPNPWGFFEMHGNVWEWCEDWYQPFTSDSVTDPLNLVPIAQGRSYRGGGVHTYTGYPYSSSRGATLPGSRFNNVGFRVARGLQ